jgi:rubrerythrin
MSILDLRHSGNVFTQPNVSAAIARKGIFNLLAAEKKHWTLAARIYAQELSQQPDSQKERTEGTFAERLREKLQQVRKATREALSYAIEGLGHSVEWCKVMLETCRHPERDCESLPLRNFLGMPDDERRRRKSIAIAGEQATARAGRLVSTITPEAFVLEARKEVRAGNLDAVGSMLEAAGARWKKLPEEIAAFVVSEVDAVDLFHEQEWRAELEERRKCLQELQEMLSQRPAIVTAEEIAEAKHSAGTFATHTMTEEWRE